MKTTGIRKTRFTMKGEQWTLDCPTKTSQKLVFWEGLPSTLDSTGFVTRIDSTSMPQFAKVSTAYSSNLSDFRMEIQTVTRSQSNSFVFVLLSLQTYHVISLVLQPSHIRQCAMFWLTTIINFAPPPKGNTQIQF